jgi:hypothetical protein
MASRFSLQKDLTIDVVGQALMIWRAFTKNTTSDLLFQAVSTSAAQPISKRSSGINNSTLN